MINNTIIFQGKDGGIEFKNDITKETDLSKLRSNSSCFW